MNLFVAETRWLETEDWQNWAGSALHLKDCGRVAEPGYYQIAEADLAALQKRTLTCFRAITRLKMKAK
jgi:hypothetical protein